MPVARFAPYVGERARTYEAIRRTQPEWAREHAVIEAAVATMPAGWTVLDAPVGTGRFLPLYAGYGLEAIGIDVSADMLAEAARKGMAARLIQADLVTTDLAPLVGSVPYTVCLRLANWLTPSEWQAALRHLLQVTQIAAWIGMHTAERAGMPLAKCAETQADADVSAWIAEAGWRVVAGHILATGARRTHAIWELRRAHADR